MLKRFCILTMVCAITGCSDPEPQSTTINIEDVASEAGLSKDDYSVDKNGVMTIAAKNDTAHRVDDFIDAFKSAGLPIGEFVVQTAETDPNHKLGRPGEYIGSAQFADTRVQQVAPLPDVDDEANLPLGGTVEVFDNKEDLQSRKQYIEQVYEMMPSAKQYMYEHNLALLRLEYELTPAQAKEYENVFMSL